MRKNKVTAGVTEIKAIGLGVLTEVLVTMVLLAVSAICISREYLSISTTNLLAVVTQFVCCLTGQIVAGKSRKEGAVKTISIVGATLCILQLCVALAVYDGVSSCYWYLLLAAIAATGCSILLCTRRKNGGKSRRKRISHR